MDLQELMASDPSVVATTEQKARLASLTAEGAIVLETLQGWLADATAALSEQRARLDALGLAPEADRFVAGLIGATDLAGMVEQVATVAQGDSLHG